MQSAEMQRLTVQLSSSQQQVKDNHAQLMEKSQRIEMLEARCEMKVEKVQFDDINMLCKKLQSDLNFLRAKESE